MAETESGALLTDAAAEAGEEASSAPEVTIGFEGWQKLVKDRVVAGDALGDVWSSIASIKGNVAELEETPPDGKTDGMFDSVATRFPITVFTILLLPCFPLGFVTGCSVHTTWGVIAHKAIYTFSGFVCISFDRSLWVWAFLVFMFWSYCIFGLSQYLLFLYLQSSDLHLGHDMEQLIMMAQNFSILFFTMPLHVTAMKVYNFRWSQCGEICRLMGVLYQLVIGSVCVFGFLEVDYLLVNIPTPPAMALYFDLRPLTVYLVKRIGYSVIAFALNRHPSATFRVTFLIAMHIVLGVTGVSAACKCKTFKSLLIFVGVDTVVKLLGFYCFTLSGTDLLKNVCPLRFVHTILTKGKPDPWPGMIKLQYRAVEMLLQTITMNSLLIGYMLTYVAFAYWIQDIDEFGPALQFWYPQRWDTMLVLFVLFLRELIYEQIAIWLAKYKTGVDMKLVFSAWLRKDSMIGWQGVLMVGLFSTFIPSLLTNTSHSLRATIDAANGKAP